MRKFYVSVSLISFFLCCVSSFAENRPAGAGGKWQVSWTGRIGTEQATLVLQQNGVDLTGTFQDLHGVSQLTGKVENSDISFDVLFQGKTPFTIVFAGTLENGSMKGSSKSKDASGYLGHGGEIVQPDRPWTATRVDGRSHQKLIQSSAKN